LVIGRVVRTAAMLLLTALCSVAALLSGVVTRSERLPSRVMAWWGRRLLRLAGCRVRVQGARALPPSGAVVVANHESYLDIPLVLYALGERVRFVAKRELGRIPVFGPAMRRAGNVFVDREDARGAAAALREAVARIGRGEWLVLFPEGTRSADGTIGAFRPGAFFVAARAGAPLVPVLLEGGARALPRGALLVRPSDLAVRILEPLAPGAHRREDLAEEVRRRLLGARGGGGVPARAGAR